MKQILGLFACALLVFSCTEVEQFDTTENSAISGKYNTMIAVEDFNYAVTYNALVTLERDEQDLKEVDRHELGERIENLYHAENALFIGSETDMHIFSIKNNGIPRLQSSTEHIEFRNTDVRVCDPVVAQQEIAYVTISSTAPSGDPCGGFIQVDELRSYDVADLSNPTLVNTEVMPSPQGLSIDRDLLFVTNLTTSTRVYEIDHNGGFNLVNNIPGAAHDVIAQDGKVLIVSSTEIKQYDYTNVNDIRHYATIKL